MAAVHGLMVTLPQMVDLSIGSPEIGAVNFNILNAVLHVIIQQMRLGDHIVEYRGADREHINNLLQTATPTLSLKVTEVMKNGQLTDPNDARRWSEVIETEHKKNISRRSSRADMSPDGDPAATVILVEPTDVKVSRHIPQIVVGLSQNFLDQIQDDIEDLKNKMEEILILPTNSSIIDAVRKGGSDSSQPVYAMWQTLHISKRVDAMEQGLSKLSSMVEDLIQDIVIFDNKPNQTASKRTITPSLSEAPRLKAGGEEATEAAKESERPPSRELRGRSSSFFGNIFSDIATRLDTIESRISAVESKLESEPDIDPAALLKEITQLKKQIKSYGEELGNVAKGANGKNLGDMLIDIEDLKTKLVKDDSQEGAESVDKLALYNEKLTNLDESFSMEIAKLQLLYIDMERILNDALEKINAKDDAVDSLSLSEMYNKMMKLQDELEAVHRNSDRLREELLEKQLTMDVLVEQIESLKTAKADREDLEDALADKADAHQVNRKVSVNQFDATCDDITKSIEHAMNKLTQQENLWKMTLEEIHNTMGLKLDKGEFDPLKEFVNRKMKSLQDRLKALIAMRQEQEAAGTKHKLLKDVNCISCDKNVIMQRENKYPTFSAPSPLPGKRSIKPYITYELDAVRKQNKLLPGGRNMNHLESALQDKIPTREKPIDKSIPQLPAMEDAFFTMFCELRIKFQFTKLRYKQNKIYRKLQIFASV